MTFRLLAFCGMLPVVIYEDKFDTRKNRDDPQQKSQMISCFTKETQTEVVNCIELNQARS